MIADLPDDLLLRIVTASSRLNGVVGKVTCPNQLRLVYTLSRVNRRLREFAYHSYLASIHSVDFSTENSAKFVSVETFRVVASCPYLDSFSLVYGEVADESERWIGLLLQSNISVLNLRGTSGLGPNTFQCFKTSPLTSAPLKHLDLSYARSIGMEVMRLVAHIATLQTLKLVGCTGVEDDSISCLADGSAAPMLLEVNLAYCMVSDAALTVLLRKTPRLVLLKLAVPAANLWSTGAHTANGVSELIRSHPRVRIKFIV
jgi:hypothetical protein